MSPESRFPEIDLPMDLEADTHLAGCGDWLEGHRGVAEAAWSAGEVGGWEVTAVFNLALRQKSR